MMAAAWPAMAQTYPTRPVVIVVPFAAGGNDILARLIVPSTANPLGVKGAGEAGAVGAPPAVINAIVDALHRRVELRHIDMPATPHRVWEMFNRIH
jgi:carbon-monoxide dehydrogenase large subunit